MKTKRSQNSPECPTLLPQPLSAKQQVPQYKWAHFLSGLANKKYPNLKFTTKTVQTNPNSLSSQGVRCLEVSESFQFSAGNDESMCPSGGLSAGQALLGLLVPCHGPGEVPLEPNGLSPWECMCALQDVHMY